VTGVMSMLQGVVVRYWRDIVVGVLNMYCRCVAGVTGVLQVCCNMLQYVMVRYWRNIVAGVLKMYCRCVAGVTGVLQVCCRCVAVCCSM